LLLLLRSRTPSISYPFFKRMSSVPSRPRHLLSPWTPSVVADCKMHFVVAVILTLIILSFVFLLFSLLFNSRCSRHGDEFAQRRVALCAHRHAYVHTRVSPPPPTPTCRSSRVVAVREGCRKHAIRHQHVRKKKALQCCFDFCVLLYVCVCVPQTGQQISAKRPPPHTHTQTKIIIEKHIITTVETQHTKKRENC
jgi:hypothetical protein